MGLLVRAQLGEFKDLAKMQDLFYNFILKKILENEDKSQKKDFIYKKSLPNVQFYDMIKIAVEDISSILAPWSSG